MSPSRCVGPSGEDRVRLGAREGHVAADLAEPAEVVALVEVERLDHLVGGAGHRQEGAHRVGASCLVLGHDAIVQPFGALLRRHLADVGRARRARRRAGSRHSAGRAAIGVAPCMLAPSSTSVVALGGLLRAPNRWPTTSAVSETSASAATAQGSALAKPRDGAAAVAPAGVPQRWQKRAPGVSGAEQVAHEAPASAVPQLEQKRPVAGAPHEGQRDGLVPSGAGRDR